MGVAMDSSSSSYRATYQDVWNGLIDAARYAAYYSELADQHRNRLKLRRFAQAAAGGLAGVSGAVNYAAEGGILMLAAGAFFVVALVFEHLYAEQTVLLDTVASDCGFTEDEYREIFERLRSGDLESSDARNRHYVLRRQLSTIANRVNISTDEDINQKITEDTYVTEKARYTPAKAA